MALCFLWGALSICGIIPTKRHTHIRTTSSSGRVHRNMYTHAHAHHIIIRKGFHRNVHTHTHTRAPHRHQRRSPQECVHTHTHTHIIIIIREDKKTQTKYSQTGHAFAKGVCFIAYLFMFCIYMTFTSRNNTSRICLWETSQHCVYGGGRVNGGILTVGLRGHIPLQ